MFNLRFGVNMDQLSDPSKNGQQVRTHSATEVFHIMSTLDPG